MRCNYLKEVKAAKGVSGLKLSQMTGISPGAISNIENGKIIAYPGWKQRIAEALEVPVEEIFPESEVE